MMDYFVADQIMRGKQKYNVLPESMKERIAEILDDNGYGHLIEEE